ncbi:hypothetical protein NLI96_g1756 [Meripilus lineatus]|uniref:Actin-like protein ARP6 n=1 Tax=Meripilus lineatus TaxID=2056292 RepID=A0AAD5VA00_9APHY|nr:hypothetical protein NLI96_g1756 [Physisporinus lineatus]
MGSKTLVVDNGAASIKIGFSTDPNAPPRVIPNAIIRSKGDKATYIGDEIQHCRDFASLHFRLPFEKGYVVDWDAQKAIWDRLFNPTSLGVEPNEISLLLTEPYFNLPNVQEVYDQFVFEEYEFQAYHRCTPASFMPWGDLFALPGAPPPECMLIVDAGFSFTHVVPMVNGLVVWSAVKRIDVGGKLLTNHLKELVSFRQWNMMDETHIINHVKESCCFVSSDYKRDLELCHTNPRRNSIVQEYILPDFSINRQGRVRKDQENMEDSYQILYMNNERFSVPEILFRPDDIGLEEVGIAGTIAHSISLLPEDIQGMFWANIGLIGGSTQFPGFRDRLLSELRGLAPADCMVSISQSKDPVVQAYRSALSLSASPYFPQRLVTRAEYLEMGSSAGRRKFADWKPISEKEAMRSNKETGGASVKGRGSGRHKEDVGDEEDGDDGDFVVAKRGRGGRRGGSASRRR